jgi:hypothetical protein
MNKNDVIRLVVSNGSRADFYLNQRLRQSYRAPQSGSRRRKQWRRRYHRRHEYDAVQCAGGDGRPARASRALNGMMTTERNTVTLQSLVDALERSW